MISQTELYEKLNHVLEERDHVYKEREKNIEIHEESLRQYEGELKKKSEEYKKQEEALSAEQEQLKIQKETLKHEEEKLEKWKKEISEEMKRLMEAKLEFRELENERMKFHNEQKAYLMQQNRSELGIEKAADVEELKELRIKYEELCKENEQLKQQIEDLQTEKGNLLRKLKDVFNPGMEEKSEINVSPSTASVQEEITKIESLGNLARKFFPEIIVEDETEDKFAGTIGDKKLQFLYTEPMTVQIMTPREETKKLLLGIKKLNKAQNEWDFSYSEGLLICSMYFHKEMEPELIMEKCAYAMNSYFK